MPTVIPSSDLDDICDFLEYEAFLKGECSLSSVITEDDDDNERLSSIKALLEHRLNLYNPYAPFEIKRGKIKSKFKTDISKEKNLHYLFCLHYSLNGAPKVSRDISTLFENIVDNSLKQYLQTSSSILTSFGDTDSNIESKIRHMLNETNEKMGDLSLIPRFAKDGGVDIVTYKSLDKRGNQIIILTDATLGKRSWKEKVVAVKVNLWTKYIHFHVNPITCLALARIIPTEVFFETSANNGLLFDRSRIVGLYTPSDPLTQILQNWKTSVCDS